MASQDLQVRRAQRGCGTACCWQLMPLAAGCSACTAKPDALMTCLNRTACPAACGRCGSYASSGPAGPGGLRLAGGRQGAQPAAPAGGAPPRRMLCPAVSGRLDVGISDAACSVFFELICCTYVSYHCARAGVHEFVHVCRAPSCLPACRDKLVPLVLKSVRSLRSSLCKVWLPCCCGGIALPAIYSLHTAGLAAWGPCLASWAAAAFLLLISAHASFAVDSLPSTFLC